MRICRVRQSLAPIDALECRRLFASFVVTSAADSGTGTLRAAILSANATTTADTITFSLPAASKTISPTTALPNITQPLTIDATTQPGFAGTPIVELSGASAPLADGLHVNASNSTIKGLVVNRWKNSGIHLENGFSGNVVRGCYVGLNVAGTAALGNSYTGVNVQGSGDTVGGTTAADRNVIAGNASNTGITLGGANNIVQGNYIGTNAAGTAAFANDIGIAVLTAGHNVGGTAVGAGNLISGNKTAGILIALVTGATTIQGNSIGTNAAGTAAIGNVGPGINVLNSSNVTIGGTVSGARNVISGNTAGGVQLSASSATIQGNYIGTNAAGTAAIANVGPGIKAASGSTAVVIGGAASGARNLLSGNTGPGIQIASIGGTSIQGNYIGTNVAGTAAVPNTTFGIDLISATETQIGGTSVAARNLISGNTLAGISIVGGEVNTIQGNYFGLNATRDDRISSGTFGIYINNSNYNTIGGPGTGSGNVFLDAGTANVYVIGTSVGTLISRNAFGIGPVNGSVLLGPIGVDFAATGDQTIIGGTSTADRNVFQNFNTAAVRIRNNSVGGTIRQNYIGLDATGVAAGGDGDGIVLNGAQYWLVANNVITSNSGNGIRILADTRPSNQNTFATNRIGVAPGADIPMGNGGNGILVDDQTALSTISYVTEGIGSAGSTSNVIAYNGSAGVRILNGEAIAVFGNSIYSNGANGIVLDPASHAFEERAVTALTSAISDGTQTTISGTATFFPSFGQSDFVQIAFYSSPVDGGGISQARTYLGEATLSTNASGVASFTRTIPVAAPVGSFITAAVRYILGGTTSEFSNPKAVISNAPPAVASGTFNFETGQNVKLIFDQDVKASLQVSDLKFHNVTTGQDFTAGLLGTTGTTTTNATFSFFPGFGLSDGNYVATLPAASVSNAFGITLAADYTLVFHVLSGDANRDRKVDFQDLVILSQNYGLTGKTFSQGNFDYSSDGKVDFADLVILAQHYNNSLPAPSAALAPASLAAATRGGKRVVSDVLA